MPSRNKTAPHLHPLHGGRELPLELGGLRHLASAARRSVAPADTEASTTPERARRESGSMPRLGCDRAVADIAIGVGSPVMVPRRWLPIAHSHRERERRVTESTLSPALRRIHKRPMRTDGHRPRRLHPKARAPLHQLRTVASPSPVRPRSDDTDGSSQHACARRERRFTSWGLSPTPGRLCEDRSPDPSPRARIIHEA